MTPYKQSFYRFVAQNYKASLAMNGCRAVIHLESKQDEVFWKKVMKKACPNDTFFFVPASRTPIGTLGTGCSMCLNYRESLDNKMAIAIDSDWRYLSQEEEIDIDHYILQTYTYSFENHLCFPERLNALPELVTGIPDRIFDFKEFLVLYSRIVYPLLLFFLYDYRQPGRSYSGGRFAKVLQSVLHLANRIANNGERILNELTCRIAEEIQFLTDIYPGYKEEAEMQRCEALGLHADNAYLFVRGHNLFDLINEIGKAVCDRLKAQERDRLKASGRRHLVSVLYESEHHFENECLNAPLDFGYPEINKCIQEARSIWK